MNPREEGTELELDFGKLRDIAGANLDVIPVALQDADSGRVLFIGYANQEALRETLRRGEAVLWSTSRNELWHKGATSGDVLRLEEVLVNCEQNSLLYRVRPSRGGACHTKDADGNTRSGCYYRRIAGPGELAFI
ncbi:MAG: phosphoribosyl-AMP cyclohydrolase [Myxococcales bacterium]|nr:phosphoribosyl-AMP cyclohydrolase [Myxococcales bacterium]